MSATLSVAFVSQLTVTETFSTGLSGNNVSAFAPQNETVTLSGSTSPAASKHAEYDVTLSSGTATVDLTALTGITADETVNGTGLKAQFLKITNKGTNANKMVFAKGASNGFQTDGATTWSMPLAPGQSMLLNLNGASDTIGGTKKTIDVTGTGSQVFSLEVVMG